MLLSLFFSIMLLLLLLLLLPLKDVGGRLPSTEALHTSPSRKPWKKGEGELRYSKYSSSEQRLIDVRGGCGVL